MDYEVVSQSAGQTIDIGKRIGRQLKGGEVIGVCGRLGSGKTHLIKGIIEGAGAAGSNSVTSPTFVIVNEYKGRLDVYHIDAYRLKSVDQFEKIGFDEFCYSTSVVLIEWADKIESALQGIDCIRIELFHSASHQRKIQFKDVPGYISL